MAHKFGDSEAPPVTALLPAPSTQDPASPSRSLKNPPGLQLGLLSPLSNRSAWVPVTAAWSSLPPSAQGLHLSRGGDTSLHELPFSHLCSSAFMSVARLEGLGKTHDYPSPPPIPIPFSDTSFG